MYNLHAAGYQGIQYIDVEETSDFLTMFAKQFENNNYIVGCLNIQKHRKREHTEELDSATQ